MQDNDTSYKNAEPHVSTQNHPQMMLWSALATAITNIFLVLIFIYQSYLLKHSVITQDTSMPQNERSSDFDIQKFIITSFKPEVDILFDGVEYSESDSRFEFKWKIHNIGDSTLNLSSGFAWSLKRCDNGSMWDGENWQPSGWQPSAAAALDWTEKFREAYELKPGATDTGSLNLVFHPKDYDFLPKEASILVEQSILVYDPDQSQLLFKKEIDRLSIRDGGQFFVGGHEIIFPAIRRIHTGKSSFRLINGTWKKLDKINHHCEIDIHM